MRKNLLLRVPAIALTLAACVVAAYAAGPGAAPSTAGTARPGLRRLGPAAGPLPELPPILLAAALNPQAKNDPEVQRLLDKAIADLQVLPQDEAARNAAFQQFVQAVRSGDADSIQKSRENLNSTNVKFVADGNHFYQQDVARLRKRIQELIAGHRTGSESPRRTSSTAPTEN